MKPMRIVCFGAHPDDLDIGMGGTIARYVAEGHKVQMVVTGIPNKLQRRGRECERSAEILGADIEILKVNFHGTFLMREIIGAYDEILARFNPDRIYTHWEHDSHQDHRLTTEAVLSAARRNKCDLYMYEPILIGGLPSSAFRGQKIVDISRWIGKKVAAMRAHRTQVEQYDFNWVAGAKGRAQQWGCWIGVKYAEAFEVVKIVVK